MQKKKGLFITIEGIEGVGKSTNIEMIKNYLNEHNIRYILTREPGGTLLAEQIREILLCDQEEVPTGLTELLLIFAARAQHLESRIMPALNAGRWVISDRFTDATYAYQGGGRGLDRNQIATLETLVQGSLRPDLTIILDLDPATGLRRVNGRGNPDRFEREQIEFFDKVRSCYLERAAAEPERCLVIDASRELELVQADLAAGLDGKLQDSFGIAKG